MSTIATWCVHIQTLVLGGEVNTLGVVFELKVATRAARFSVSTMPAHQPRWIVCFIVHADCVIGNKVFDFNLRVGGTMVGDDEGGCV